MAKFFWFYKNPVRSGILGSIILAALYITIVSIANSFDHAVQQFFEIWYLMSLMIIGFGVQVGLFAFIGNSMHHAPKSSIATSGGVSTASMAACCAHHLTDIIPLFGVSAAATFLVEYQQLFLVIGVLSNIFGIVLMISIIKKHNLGKQNYLLKHISE